MLTQDEIRNLPVVVEFVAVPSSFDIDLYLSMREGAGMFDGRETNLKHVKFIAETIKASPWFVLSKAPETTIQSAFFCLELFREVGLTLDSNDSTAYDSKFRGRTWKGHAKYEYHQGHISQAAFVMIVVNVYKLVEDGMIAPIVEKIVEVENRMADGKAAQEMLDKK